MATPFCSCSAVPVFTGFIRAGVPVSQAISFLVASPLVNEIAIIMLATGVGWGIAGAYAAMGFAIAVGAGISLRRFAKPSLTEVRQVMSVTALSFLEALLLRKVMKPKLLAVYFATVSLGIILVGVVFNLILPI